jgi:predicted acetylornithine/succinylornithine family transaminase
LKCTEELKVSHWQELERRYYLQVARRLPVTLVRGAGARVWDETGKEYLDFVAGWAVNNLGHCHPVVVDAITEQARTLIHTSNQFYTVPQIKLAQLLVENSVFDRVFFCNSGAEANEGAVKLARKYGRLRRNGAYEVVTTFNSFHGRTLAMVAATGKPHYQEPFKPLPPGFVNVPFNSLEAIQQATTERTCAVMLELVQGEGGVYEADPEYVRGVSRWCRDHGLLFIVDEVQTGIGRTGTLFAYEQYGVEPDVMTLAKGLGGGIPIGAFLVKEEAAVLEPGDHGSTFGGNPLACAAGYATVKYVIEKDIPAHAARVGAYLKARLSELRSRYEWVTEVRGRGLLLAVQFDREVSERVVLGCLEAGLLVNGVTPSAIRLMPPLIITEAEADQAVGILDSVLARVGAGS